MKGHYDIKPRDTSIIRVDGSNFHLLKETRRKLENKKLQTSKRWFWLFSYEEHVLCPRMMP